MFGEVSDYGGRGREDEAESRVFLGGLARDACRGIPLVLTVKTLHYFA